MKKIFAILSLSFLIICGSAYTIQSLINWKIDSEKAMVKFVMNAHNQELVGNFKAAKGEVKFDEKDPAASSIVCSVDVVTINTGVEPRDKHLQSKGFFDAAANPVIKFTSSKIEKTTDGYLATGNLLMKATTKEISIPFVFEKNPGGAVFKGSFVVKRNDYNVGKPDPDMSDEVTIKLEIPVTEK